MGHFGVHFEYMVCKKEGFSRGGVRFRIPSPRKPCPQRGPKTPTPYHHSLPPLSWAPPSLVTVCPRALPACVRTRMLVRCTAPFICHTHPPYSLPDLIPDQRKLRARATPGGHALVPGVCRSRCAAEASTRNIIQNPPRGEFYKNGATYAHVLIVF